MKAVTIAKIARLVVIIAVGIVIAIPTFAGIESLKINNGEFVMTNSIYEVNCMTAEDLATNIKDVTNGETGYKIVYGGQTPVDVPGGETTEFTDLMDTIKAEGDAHPDDPANGKYYTATLLDKNGAIAKQQTIQGSANLTQYIYTGIRMTESMVNMVKMSVVLDSVVNDKRITISQPEITPMGDSYRVKMKIPYLTFASAIAAGAADNIPDEKKAKMGLTIGVEYNSFFDAKFRLEVPMSKFFQGEGGGSGGIPDVNLEVEKDPHAYHGKNPGEYGSVKVNEEIKITAGGMSGLEDISGSIGTFGNGTAGVRLEVDESGQVRIMSTGNDDSGNPLDLIESIEKSRESNGDLVINPDGGIADPITIKADQVDSLMEMAAELIELYRGM